MRLLYCRIKFIGFFLVCFIGSAVHAATLRLTNATGADISMEIKWTLKGGFQSFSTISSGQTSTCSLPAGSYWIRVHVNEKGVYTAELPLVVVSDITYEYNVDRNGTLLAGALKPITTRVRIQNACNSSIKPNFSLGKGWQDYGVIEPGKEFSWDLTVMPGTYAVRAAVDGKFTVELPFTDIAGGGVSEFHVNVNGDLMPSSVAMPDTIKTYVTLTNNFSSSIEPEIKLVAGGQWKNYGKIEAGKEFRWELAIFPGTYYIRAKKSDGSFTAALPFTDLVGLGKTFFTVNVDGNLLPERAETLTTKIFIQNVSDVDFYPTFDLDGKGMQAADKKNRVAKNGGERLITVTLTGGTRYVGGKLGDATSGQSVTSLPFTVYDDGKQFDFFVNDDKKFLLGRARLRSQVTIQNASAKTVEPVFDMGNGVRKPTKQEGPETLAAGKEYTYTFSTKPGTYYVGGIIKGVKSLTNLPFTETGFSTGGTFNFYVSGDEKMLPGKHWIKTAVLVQNVSCFPITPYFKKGIAGDLEKQTKVEPNQQKLFTPTITPGTNYILADVVTADGVTVKSAQLAFTDFDGKGKHNFYVNPEGMLMPDSIKLINTKVTVQNDYTKVIAPEVSFCGNRESGYKQLTTIASGGDGVYSLTGIPGTHWIRIRHADGTKTPATIFTDIAGDGASFFHVTKDGKLEPGRSRITTTVTVQNAYSAAITPSFNFKGGSSDAWNRDTRYDYSSIGVNQERTWTFNVAPGTHYVKAAVTGKADTGSLVFTDIAGGGKSNFYVDANGTLMPEKARVTGTLIVQNISGQSVTPEFSFRGPKESDFKAEKSSENKESVANYSEQSWQFTDTPMTYWISIKKANGQRTTLPFTLVDGGTSVFHINEQGDLLPERVLYKAQVTLRNSSDRPFTPLFKLFGSTNFEAKEAVAPQSSKTFNFTVKVATTHQLQLDFDGKKTVMLPFTVAGDKQQFNYFANVNYDLLSGVECKCSVGNGIITFKTPAAECDQCKNACEAVGGTVGAAFMAALVASAGAAAVSAATASGAASVGFWKATWAAISAEVGKISSVKAYDFFINTYVIQYATAVAQAQAAAQALSEATAIMAGYATMAAVPVGGVAAKTPGLIEGACVGDEKGGK